MGSAGIGAAPVPLPAQLSVDPTLPLSSLLSFPLVAFTIESDNEFEHRMPHSTTRGEQRPGRPWLLSMAMWSTCLRFLPDEGMTVGELERMARAQTNLPGMQRWRYITMDPYPGTSARGIRPITRVRPTQVGSIARDLWAEIISEVEARWQGRLGEDFLARLRGALAVVVARRATNLPDCLPIVRGGLSSPLPPAGDGARGHSSPDQLSLPALLSRTLLALTLDFERKAPLSLPICANVLRLMADDPVRLSALPRLSGVSAEALAVACGFLMRRGFAIETKDPPGSRHRALLLTDAGRRVRNDYRGILDAIERDWKRDLGDSVIGLRVALEELAASDAAQAALLRATEPYSDGWRASVPRPSTLPYHPMILHRGGYPDGS